MSLSSLSSFCGSGFLCGSLSDGFISQFSLCLFNVPVCVCVSLWQLFFLFVVIRGGSTLILACFCLSVAGVLLFAALFGVTLWSVLGPTHFHTSAACGVLIGRMLRRDAELTLVGRWYELEQPAQQGCVMIL